MAGRSRRLTGSSTTGGLAGPEGGTIEQGDVDQGPVEAGAMAEQARSPKCSPWSEVRSRACCREPRGGRGRRGGRPIWSSR